MLCSAPCSKGNKRLGYSFYKAWWWDGRTTERGKDQVSLKLLMMLEHDLKTQ